MRMARLTFCSKLGIVCCAVAMIAGAAWASDQTGGVDFVKKYQDLANQTIQIGDSDWAVRYWSQPNEAGTVNSYYEIFKGEQSLRGPQQTSFDLKLRYGVFDPFERTPAVDEAFQAGPDAQAFIVQFATQTLEAYKIEIESMGAAIGWFVPNHAFVMIMDPETRDAVANLPYVRWVGPFHPAYRLEEFILDNVAQAHAVYPLETYNIMLLHSSIEQKNTAAQRILALGGIVEVRDAGKYLVRATLTPEQLFEVATFDEVLFIDRWGPYETDMNNAREYGGANYIETTPAPPGYTGQGVRGEVFDAGFNVAHVDFQSRPLIEHTAPGSDSHGAATSGIVFGDGTGNPNARGMLPDGQGIVANYSGYLGEPARYAFTQELLSAPYYAVFQTSSVGSPRTFYYTTISADHDAMLFDFDIAHCQSQSNAGNQDSRPEAWAKNIISGGGVYHYDTLDPSDDCWCSGGSTGPAQDGRIKPDLCAYYDDILTTTTGSPTSYTTGFGGTSGATPIICGHVGLVFQMWADGIFGNAITPGATVFENRCHMTTAKALLINTANQYPFTGTGHDLTRTHQGWGWPSVENLYDLRDKLLVIDEDDILTNLQSTSYQVQVQSGEPALRATLVFADPPGDPAASEARINDLTLKVTSPSATQYWGNNGLLEGNWSTAGGTANTVDTVECVFVENPEAGWWTIEISADEIVEDSHVETPAMDADFALVVTGGEWPHFSLQSTPATLDVCAPADAVYTLDLGQYGGYSESVTLSATGNPAGTTVTFSSNPVTPPATPTLTVSNTGAAAAGNYTIEVTGTAIDMTRYLSLELNLNTAVPGAVNLTAPANGSIDQAMQPTFTWNAATQALDYDFELATDSGFTNIVHSENLMGTSLDLPVSLQSLTQYFWHVRANNGCGDSGYSATFSFTTIDQPDYMTEQFTSGVDLDGWTVFFTPNGVADFYDYCGEAAAALPTDPAGGTVESLSDDGSATVTLTTPISFYGVQYSTVYINANGNMTFTAADSDYTETLADHFDTPRISGVFDDLGPHQGGQVSWKETADRLAITYFEVPELSQGNANTFQFELLYNGEVHVTWLQTDIQDCIAGLSEGQGEPGDFLATDLSAAPSCEEPPPPPCIGDVNGDGEVNGDDFTAAYEEWCGTMVEADVNENGWVELMDLLWLMDPTNYFTCPE